MPTSDQIMMLLNQRGSLRLNEIRLYFHLNGSWVKPLTQTLDALVASGEVYCDSFGAYLLTFAVER
jgi:hypothetical protein